MSAGFGDFPRHVRARAAAVPPPAESELNTNSFEAPAADEAALMNLVRLLNRTGATQALTPVEQAFVIGAKAIFEELAQVCDDLLAPAPPPNTSTPASATAAAPASLAPPTTPAQPAKGTDETATSRTRRRGNPAE